MNGIQKCEGIAINLKGLQTVGSGKRNITTKNAMKNKNKSQPSGGTSCVLNMCIHVCFLVFGVRFTGAVCEAH